MFDLSETFSLGVDGRGGPKAVLREGWIGWGGVDRVGMGGWGFDLMY